MYQWYINCITYELAWSVAHTHARKMATKAMAAKPNINTLQYIYVKLCIWLRTLCVVVITISQKNIYIACISMVLIDLYIVLTQDPFFFFPFSLCLCV